jgi:hypothetical protein
MAKRHNNSAKAKVEKQDPIKAAEEFGIDISALRDNLKLSYGERIRRHQIALNTIEKLRKAKRV